MYSRPCTVQIGITPSYVKAKLTYGPGPISRKALRLHHVSAWHALLFTHYSTMRNLFNVDRLTFVAFRRPPRPAPRLRLDS